MSLTSLLWTLLPIAVILVMLLVFRKPADISGIIGWGVISLVAVFFFQTSLEVVLRSTAAGFIKSFSVSLIVATSLLQMAFIEKTGGLKRITIFIKTLSPQARAAQIMMVNIGFGTLMVAVGATPVSILPPILLAMGYSTYIAIALPAIGYDSLCTYALLGAPIVAFVDIANGFLKDNPINGVTSITLAQAGGIFFWFLPLSSMLIGFSMLWIVGRRQAIREGWLPCLITGAVIGVISYFTNRVENTVVLTGVLCGIGVIGAMVVYLKLTRRPVIDKSLLTEDEIAYARQHPLWKALTPWFILIVLILALNLPKPVFNYLYRTLTMPIYGIAANDALVNGIPTRALWSAYTWIFASVLLAIPFIRPSKSEWRDILKTWIKRAPRPVFSAAIFFAIGEVMNMAGFSMSSMKWETPSMVRILADYSAQFFKGAYSFISGFIGLFGGFITGSEASTIGMFAKYALTTAKNLNMPVASLIIIAAGLAFGSGLASIISPAKLQNAAASIDKLGEENKVIRTAFVISLLLVTVMSIYVVILLNLNLSI
ncbi:MAG: L-lactate permease [Clostridiaceae bacterium]|nr:L-lactate permease [Clostridiaceae bacterium]